MSYFEDYMNLRGERTLRAHSQPVDLARFDRSRSGWMTATDGLWWSLEHLAAIRHRALLTPAMIQRLSTVDRRSRMAALLGYRAH
jgi:hypothetical protein